MRCLALGLSLLALSACGAATTPAPTVSARATIPADLVIANVTVIDPESGSRIEGQDVLVRDGRITAVIAAGSGAVDTPQRIDGSGKYLMPGLFDMHAHSSFAPVHISTLKLMSANGVTGIREMGSDCMRPGGIAMCIDDMRVSQGKIEAGEMVGPRIVELSTQKIGSGRSDDADDYVKLYRPGTAEEARVTVAGLAERHPDILKVNQEFNPEAFRALLEAAKERGLKVGGHIPMMFSVKDVAEMGMTSIEHARDLPLDCSTGGADMRATMDAIFRGENVERPDRRAIPALARDGFDEAICMDQIEAMVDHGTYYVPTHLTREMDYRAGEGAYRGDPRGAYIPAMQWRGWNEDLDRTASAPPESVKDLADFFQLGLKTTKMAHDAGVKIMAGTDANDTMIFPGFSLHDELRHLVAAGLTPMEALQTATSVPAEYLGRTDDFGGVNAGKLADLVLLNADPTADIANTTKIEAVIQGGQVRDRAALDALLGEVKAWVVIANAQSAAQEKD